MKKLIILFILLLASPVYAWNLLCVDNPQVQGDRVGYRLMPGTEWETDIFQDSPKFKMVEANFNNSGKDLFYFRTNNMAQIEKTPNLDEFVAMEGNNDNNGGIYVDALMRFATGDSNFTLAQLKLMFRCQWQREVGGVKSMTSGTIAQYEADTDATGVVHFTGSVRIFGK